METVSSAIELAALAIEVAAIAIILIALGHGTFCFVMRIREQSGNAYDRYKGQIGKGLLLGLEFLVAADIIRTVALKPTLQSVMVLALLVVVRTFLSWSIVVEIEGRWPWHGSGRREQPASPDAVSGPRGGTTPSAPER
jgi:uncharacterized membrane protein